MQETAGRGSYVKELREREAARMKFVARVVVVEGAARTGSGRDEVRARVVVVEEIR